MRYLKAVTCIMCIISSLQAAIVVMNPRVPHLPAALAGTSMELECARIKSSTNVIALQWYIDIASEDINSLNNIQKVELVVRGAGGEWRDTRVHVPGNVKRESGKDTMRRLLFNKPIHLKKGEEYSVKLKIDSKKDRKNVLKLDNKAMVVRLRDLRAKEKDANYEFAEIKNIDAVQGQSGGFYPVLFNERYLQNITSISAVNKGFLGIWESKFINPYELTVAIEDITVTSKHRQYDVDIGPAIVFEDRVGSRARLKKEIYGRPKAKSLGIAAIPYLPIVIKYEVQVTYHIVDSAKAIPGSRHESFISVYPE